MQLYAACKRNALNIRYKRVESMKMENSIPCKQLKKMIERHSHQKKVDFEAGSTTSIRRAKMKKINNGKC